MRKTIYKPIKLFLLMVLSFILITACYQPVNQQQNSTKDFNSAIECKVVRHKLGEVCIPANPQRIIILDESYLLDAVSALGIELAGYAPCVPCLPPDTLGKFVVDLTSVGDSYQPSLEKILNLKPDLILGLEGHEKIYSLLSQIAPTVIIKDSEANGFEPTLRYLAEILDRQDRVEDILAKYESKVREFRQQLGEKLKTKTVSIIGIYGSSFYVEKLENRIYGQVMHDLGIQFAPVHKTIKEDGYTSVSIETLPEWDADFLLVIQTHKRNAEDFAAMLEQPIWSTLDAVQNQRVHPMVLEAWGPITAMQFIDDLYQYFINVL